jgi:hypothetical protein
VSSFQHAFQITSIRERRILRRKVARPCEKPNAPDCDRISCSFKTALGAYIVSQFNFDIDPKNIILVAFRFFVFSHGLGHYRTLDGGPRRPRHLESHSIAPQFLPRAVMVTTESVAANLQAHPLGAKDACGLFALLRAACRPRDLRQPRSIPICTTG